VGHQSAKGKKKPKPFTIPEALKRLGATQETTLSFGNSLKDFKAATGAGIKHYACLWAKEEDLLRENGYRNFGIYPKKIIEILV